LVFSVTVSEKEEKSASIPWLPLITLIGVSSGAFLYFSQLTSSRPGGGDTRLASNTFDNQTVDARLWQDPLGVVVADLEKDQKKIVEHSVKHFQELVTRKCFTESEISPLSAICPLKEEFRFARQFQILAAMIPGGPYVEDVERRVRSRRAVVEGLGIAGYQPEKDDEIGYFCMPWLPLEPNVATCVPVLEKNRSNDERPVFSFKIGILDKGFDPIRMDRKEEDLRLLRVPYEWYEPAAFGVKKKNAKHVLVLWLIDDAFRDAPLARLADLISWFRLKRFTPGARLLPFFGRLFTPVRNGVLLPLPDFAVLGPDNSGTLRKMVLEARADAWHDETTRCLATTHFFSSQAAAAENQLLPEFPTIGGCFTCQNLIEQKVKRRESGSAFCFERTILLDNEIVTTLWQELDLRGVKRDDHVAIISEQDTYYARALSSSFRHPDAGPTPKNVRSYNYLRGIDGKLPSDEKDQREKKSSAANGSKDTDLSRRPTEETEGLNQADDLRRLAEMLQNLDVEWRSKGGGGLKAIGLLGSDVYDKLELLKALRPLFPEAVFFTNNLEARLAHPDEWKETHNLVVVSALGLSLEGELGEKYQEVAPFRDSGQTALFSATLEAMGKPGIKDAKPKSPVIFEIGRNGPKELSVPKRQSILIRFGCFIVVGTLFFIWIHLVSRITPEASWSCESPQSLRNKKSKQGKAREIRLKEKITAGGQRAEAI
jgi:hypothetical protein